MRTANGLTALAVLVAAGVLVWGGERPVFAQVSPTTGVSVDVYRIGVGDVLGVSVLGHPEYSIDAKVRPDGMITYPISGNIVVAGKSVGEVQKTIESALLKSKRLSRAVVTINILGREPKTIGMLGVVRTVGKIELKDGWRVLDAIAAAGGVPSDRYEFYEATLFQRARPIKVNLGKLYAGDVSENRLLEAGDTITVVELDQSQTVVQVIGEVARPGASVALPRDGSVVTVLNAVGGVTPKAALSKAVIERKGEVIKIDLRGYNRDGTVPTKIKMEPGDKLIVPENREIFRALGAVGRPGDNLYPDDRELTFSQALSYVGVQTQGADLKKTTLVRKGTDGKDVKFVINFEKMLKGDLSDDMAVLPNDQLYVPANSPRRSFSLQDAVGIVGGIAGIFFTIRQLR